MLSQESELATPPFIRVTPFPLHDWPNPPRFLQTHRPPFVKVPSPTAGRNARQPASYNTPVGASLSR
jgi:hypothetical protein